MCAHVPSCDSSLAATFEHVVNMHVEMSQLGHQLLQLYIPLHVHEWIIAMQVQRDGTMTYTLIPYSSTASIVSNGYSRPFIQCLLCPGEWEVKTEFRRKGPGLMRLLLH